MRNYIIKRTLLLSVVILFFVMFHHLRFDALPTRLLRGEHGYAASARSLASISPMTSG